MTDKMREGEIALPFDPADRAEARVAFIGRIRSPWSRADCPKNILQARARGLPARIVLDPAYAQALTGLEPGRAIVVLYWMDRGGRGLLVQNPHHVAGQRGTFSIRSPNRPNPICMSTVLITSIDHKSGVIGIDATDAFDGTPVVDIKPWMPRVDVPPGWHPEE